MTGGRVVAVVGASSGIGLATALELARRGDRLMMAARDLGALERARAECLAAGADDVLVRSLDLGDPAAGTQLVAGVLQRWDRLDAVVLSGTSMAYGPVEDVPAAVFETVIDVAINGTARIARAVLPLFRRQEGGTLVVVNSLLGSITVPGMGAYATGKWGQHALVRTLQQEVRDDDGVHVCLVRPGSTNTPIYYQAANFLGRGTRPPFPVLQPERAGRVIADLLDRPRADVSAAVGPTNPMIIAGFRLARAVFDPLVGPLFQRLGLTGEQVAPHSGNVRSASGAHNGLHGHWPGPSSGTGSTTPETTVRT